MILTVYRTNTEYAATAVWMALRKAAGKPGVVDMILSRFDMNYNGASASEYQITVEAGSVGEIRSLCERCFAPSVSTGIRLDTIDAKDLYAQLHRDGLI